MSSGSADAAPDDRFCRIGRLDEFIDREPACRTVGGLDLVIVRAGDAVYVLRGVCPHHGAPLCRGEVSGTMMPSDPGTLVYGMDMTVIRCPWHGYEFDLRTGEALFGTFRGRAKVYRTSVRDGQVWARLPRRT